MLAFGLQCEVDHHDRVLLHQPDQQHDTDHRDQVQAATTQQQRQQRADGRRGQGGQNGDRMDEALIQHTQDQIHHHHGGQYQPQRAGKRGAEGVGGTLQAQFHAGRQADGVARALDAGHRFAQ